MRELSARVLALVALCAAVVSWVVLGALDARGAGTLPLPWTAPASLLVLAAAVVSAGWPVRRWNQGHRDRPLDALRAARAAVLARAASVTGAALGGAYAGFAVVLLPTVDVEPRRARLLLALFAVGASGVLAVVGALVERWCRLPPRDPDDDRGGSSGDGRALRRGPGGAPAADGDRGRRGGRGDAGGSRDGRGRRG